jgi:hypothetical protein
VHPRVSTVGTSLLLAGVAILFVVVLVVGHRRQSAARLRSAERRWYGMNDGAQTGGSDDCEY